MSMIRIGDVAASAANVLDGTRFQQITDPINLTVRARRIGSVGFAAADKAKLTIGSIELTNVTINQQDTTNPAPGANSVGLRDLGVMGLNSDDVIWSGRVNPGSLILTFANAGTTNRNVLWDVTAMVAS